MNSVDILVSHGLIVSKHAWKCIHYFTTSSLINNYTTEVTKYNPYVQTSTFSQYFSGVRFVVNHYIKRNV